MLASCCAARTIAVPGKMTSAFLALQLFLGEFKFIVVPFDKIFDAVESGRADAGLIIHEGQLTYARSGFEKIVDLGEWWKRKTGLPLPLGGNVVRKDIPPPVRRDISEIIRESIDYGLTHRDEAVAYSLAYARDMNAQLASKFIGMYVNEFTRDYGETGRAAIRKFLTDARDKGYIDHSNRSGIRGITQKSTAGKPSFVGERSACHRIRNGRINDGSVRHCCRRETSICPSESERATRENGTLLMQR